MSDFVRISSRDTGKTMVDASLGEIMTTCEKITWLLSEGERWLKPEYRCLLPSFLIGFSTHLPILHDSNDLVLGLVSVNWPIK